MEDIKDEMNARAIVGETGGPAKRIAGESNREYVLQKTDTERPCSGLSPAWQGQMLQHQHILKPMLSAPASLCNR